jgi:hypothetical protein
MQVVPIKFTFVKSNSRKNFREFTIFFGRFRPLLKFNKDSNVESVPGLLTLLLFGIGCRHNLGKRS